MGEVKYYLNQVYRIEKMLKMLEREYNQKVKEIDNISISNSEIKLNSVSSKVENKVIELLALENDIKEYKIKKEVSIDEISRVIDKVDDEILKKLLKLRYLEFKKWEDIAYILGYSNKHVFKLHNQALKYIEKFLKDDTLWYFYMWYYVIVTKSFIFL